MNTKELARVVMVEDLAAQLVAVRAAQAHMAQMRFLFRQALEHGRRTNRRPRPFMAHLARICEHADAEFAYLNARHDALSHNLAFYDSMNMGKKERNRG